MGPLCPFVFLHVCSLQPLSLSEWVVSWSQCIWQVRFHPEIPLLPPHLPLIRLHTLRASEEKSMMPRTRWSTPPFISLTNKWPVMLLWEKAGLDWVGLGMEGSPPKVLADLLILTKFSRKWNKFICICYVNVNKLLYCRWNILFISASTDKRADKRTWNYDKTKTIYLN